MIIVIAICHGCGQRWHAIIISTKKVEEISGLRRPTGLFNEVRVPDRVSIGTSSMFTNLPSIAESVVKLTRSRRKCYSIRPTRTTIA